jgi:putative membrane protein
MVEIVDLPHVLAGLNGASALLLCAGYVFIRRRQRAAHKASMLAAVAVSGAFLVIYVTYHLNGGFLPFGGEGMIRPVYFAILVGHVLLALVIVPLVPMTLARAFKNQETRHRRLARWTLPIWLYVGVSGVAVYVMTAHLFPHGGG